MDDDTITATDARDPSDIGHASTLGSGLEQGSTPLGRGALVGRYLVFGHLGTGGMGAVYAAHDPELDRKVALKLVKSASGGSEGRARLLREAQAMAKLSHPNVVAVYDVGTVGDEVFIAMEFIEGVTLKTWLAERPRPWREILPVFLAAGRGLVAAHEAGLVHRDLKPDNVMVGVDGRVRVMDFGLARSSALAAGPRGDVAVTERPLGGDLTRTGARLGTPAYMAPEQWEGVETSAKTDQFAFCVAIWEAVFGDRPFAGATMMAMMVAVTRGELRAPEHSRRAPAWLRAALTRGLARRPDDRWPSMEVLIAELGRERWAAARRRGLGVLALAAALATVVGLREVAAKRRAAEAEAERAERAEASAAADRERADREAFERAAIADAKRSADVLRLATAGGRERDALVLGVEVLSPFGPDFIDAPEVALEGLSRALPAMHPIVTLPRPERAVKQLWLSHDGSRLLVVLAEDPEIQVWETRPLRRRATVHIEERQQVTDVSRDGRRAVLTSGEGCTVYDLDTAALVLRVDACADPVFMVDGDGLLARGPEPADPGGKEPRLDRLQAISLADGARRWQTRPRAGALTLVVHPDGERVLASWEPESSLRIFDARTGVESPGVWRDAPAPRPGQRGTLRSWLPVVSPDGQQVALQLRGNEVARGATDVASPLSPDRIAIFDLQTHDVQVIESDHPMSVGFSRDGLWLEETRHRFLHRDSFRETILYARDRTGGNHPLWVKNRVIAMSTFGMTAVDSVLVDFVELGTLSLSQAPLLHQRLPPQTSLTGNGYAFQPESELFALITKDHRPTLWRARDPLQLQAWRSPPGETIIDFDESFVATETLDHQVRLHSRSGGRLAHDLVTPLRRIWGVDFTGSGVWLHGEEAQRATSRYHDGDTGQELFRVFHRSALGGDASLQTAARAPIYAAADGDGVVTAKDVARARVLCEIPTDGSLIESLVLADDGRALAFIRSSGSLELWSTESCASKLTLQVDTDAELDLHGGRWLVASSAERVHVLDIDAGELVFTTPSACPDAERVQSPLLAPDGRLLLTRCTGSGRATGVVWDVEEGIEHVRIDDPRIASAMFWTADALIATREMRRWIFLDARTGAESLELHPRAPIGEFQEHADGQRLDVQERFGPTSVIRTYPTTRAGLVTAACTALAESEVAAAVAAACEGAP